jgi:hypothetical protein
MNPTHLPHLRIALRWLHITLAGAVGAYLYSPWANNPAFATLIKFALFPLTGLAGLALWLQPRLARQVLNNRR